MTAPPGYVIESAIEAAAFSPCAKSKRGVVAMIVREQGRAIHPVIAARGWNGQPDGFACARNDACRSACAKLCMHAEQRAVLAALRSWSGHERNMELVHVKVVDGELVPGGGPSCWQCSRLVLDVGMRGVWLYEGRGVTPTWVFYSAGAFHCETLRACELEVGP